MEQRKYFYVLLRPKIYSKAQENPTYCYSNDIHYLDKKKIASTN